MLLPESDIFTPIVAAPENYVNKLPIISLSSSNNQPQSSNIQSASSSSIGSSSLPTPSQLPYRYRNEPAVVGCATGEVRRMRSVLDMKLGGMALPLDAHLGLDTTFVAAETRQIYSQETSSSSENSTSNENLLPGKKRSPAPSIETQANVPDKKRLSRVHAAALSITQQQQQQQMVDEFGIVIPTSTQIKMAHETSSLKEDGRLLQTISSSSLTDGSCSVVLAESPSRLDLSALLC